MEKKRRIAKVVKKVSFAEAKKNEDLYWSNISEEVRLKSAIDLRKIFFGKKKSLNTQIAKVVFKRSIYEERQKP